MYSQQNDEDRRTSNIPASYLKKGGKEFKETFFAKGIILKRIRTAYEMPTISFLISEARRYSVVPPSTPVDKGMNLRCD